MHASFEGHFVCVDFLLKMGAEKDAKTNAGWTALIAASAAGNFECAGLLLKAGADIDAKDKDGFTVLMLASDCGYPGALIFFSKPVQTRMPKTMMGLQPSQLLLRRVAKHASSFSSKRTPQVPMPLCAHSPC